jgi:hypothetical protein
MGLLDRMKASMQRVHLTYLGGHPDLPKSQRIQVEREGDNIVFYVSHKDAPVASIPLNAMKSVRLERAGSRSAGKAAAGAIAGGYLAGPAGLIAGAALGGRKKKESVIIVTIQQGPVELDILLGGENAERNYPKFTQLLK